jgi:serralysin
MSLLIAVLLSISAQASSFEFYQEPWATGVFISDFDVPHLKGDHLNLIIDIFDDEDSKENFNIWKSPEQFNLSFCISDEFKDNKQRVIEAFEVAISEWTKTANLIFNYKSEEDAECTEFNENVVFDVRPIRGAPYLARAFFPNFPRLQRNVIIDDSSLEFNQQAFTGVVRHELGHVLGFRHEHIHPENNGFCPQGGTSKPLTDYDKKSVMHYPQCAGENSFEELVLTEKDLIGAGLAYPY